MSDPTPEPEVLPASPATSPEPEEIPVPAERTLAILPPEVIRMITAYLPTWSRTCCVAVCKAVRNIFMPWLFERIELGPRESLAFGSVSTQKLFSLNSSRARSFTSSMGLGDGELLYRQQASGLQEVRLVFSPTHRPLILADQAVRVVEDLVRTNSNLALVNMRGSLDWVGGLINTRGCEYRHLVSQTISWLGMNLVPMVEEGEELEIPSLAEVGLLANLETLCLHRFGGSLHQIATLISRCGKLKVVDFHHTEWSLSDEDLSLLMGPLRRLGHISWVVKEIGAGDLEQYLALGPQQSRSFLSRSEPGSRSELLGAPCQMDQIPDTQCQDKGCGGYAGSALQMFLMEASSLEELRALPEGFTDSGEYQHERMKIENMRTRREGARLACGRGHAGRP